MKHPNVQNAIGFQNINSFSNDAIHKNPFGVILFTDSTIEWLKFATNWDKYTSLLKFCSNKY